jgi:hypothetical protein
VGGRGCGGERVFLVVVVEMEGAAVGINVLFEIFI